MFIKNYGLFWQVEEVEWSPGSGNKDIFNLLGRRGINHPKLRLADFRMQQGIYILYNDYGPYYAGLTRKQGLGKRLKDHLQDEHADYWSRFSWFGFRKVLKSKDEKGICCLKQLANSSNSDPNAVISDVESLLIRAMGLSNINQNKFKYEERWEQVKKDEVEKCLVKVAASYH